MATVVLAELGVEIIGLAADGIEKGKKAVISVRPEKIRISQTPGRGQNVFRAKVVKTAYIGSDTRIILEATANIRLGIWEQNKTSTLDPGAYYHAGQEVWLTLPQENTLVLLEE